MIMQDNQEKMELAKSCQVIEVLPPMTVCTETYLIAGTFEDRKQAENLQTYLSTKFVRFLVAQIAVSQHITRACFCFCPSSRFLQILD